MENETFKVATLEEIGSRLERAREAHGIKPHHISDKLGVNPSTYRRWEMGEREGGCQLIARAAALVGLSPNSILLADRVPESVLDNDDRDNLRLITDVLVQMTQLCGGARERPIAIFANHLVSVLGQMKACAAGGDRENKSKIPSGTTLKSEVPGIKVYEPPSAKKTHKRDNRSIAGESLNPYGIPAKPRKKTGAGNHKKGTAPK